MSDEFGFHPGRTLSRVEYRGDPLRLLRSIDLHPTLPLHLRAEAARVKSRGRGWIFRKVGGEAPYLPEYQTPPPAPNHVSQASVMQGEGKGEGVGLSHSRIVPNRATFAGIGDEA